MKVPEGFERISFSYAHKSDLEKIPFILINQLLVAIGMTTPHGELPWSRRWEYSWAILNAKLSEGMRILDAGCGCTSFMALLSNYLEYHACDIAPQPKMFRVQFKEANITKLDYLDDYFDRVFCLSVFEHLEESDAEQALSEFYRVLVPGGYLVYTRDMPETAYQGDSRDLLRNEELGITCYGEVLKKTH